MKNKIKYAGTIRGGQHQQDFIISPEGVCKALTSGSHLNADWMTLIYEEYRIQDDSKSGR